MIHQMLIPRTPLRPIAFPVPTSFTVLSGTSIRVFWTNGDASKPTQVWRDGVLIVTKSAAATFHDDTGLSAGVSYQYQFRHASPNPTPTTFSPLSAKLFAYTAPAAPTGLAAISSGSTVHVSWSNPNPGLQTQVYRGVTFLGTTGVGDTSFDDTSVPDGTYDYSVRAFDGTNVSSLTTVSGVEVSLVDPPTAFSANVTTDDVALTWTKASALLQTKVYRDGVLIATKTAGTESHTDSNVANGTYTYTIKHYDGANESAPVSTTPTTTTVAYLAPPSALGLTNAVYANRVTLGWTNAGAYSTQIWRDAGGGYALLTTVGSGVTSYNDDSVGMGDDYNYKVRHTNGGIDSAFSSVQSITTAVPAFTFTAVDGSWGTNKFVVSFGVTIMPKDGTVTFDGWSDNTSLNGGGGASGAIGSPYQFGPEGYTVTKLGPEFGTMTIQGLSIRDSGGTVVVSEDVDGDFAYDSDPV